MASKLVREIRRPTLLIRNISTRKLSTQTCYDPWLQLHRKGKLANFVEETDKFVLYNDAPRKAPVNI